MYDLAFEASCQLAKTLYTGYDHLAKIIFYGLGSLWFLLNVQETFVFVFGNVKDIPFQIFYDLKWTHLLLWVEETVLELKKMCIF